MDSVRLAYLIGCKLAMENADQFAQISQEIGQQEVTSKDKDNYADETTRNLKEHNRHTSGASFGNPIELSKGVDPVFMNT